MPTLHFNLSIIEFLADHRTALLTRVFLAASVFGTLNIYIPIVTFIYVAWNKKLAIRLVVLLLLTASLNGLLKLFFRNPRPFIREGTYLKKWAVSAKAAKSLAAEYSTPSGHAMSSSAFYAYLYASFRNRYVKVFTVLAIVLIGCSRPYLGVHFVEDVLLGWAFGLACALVAIKYLPAFCSAWNRLAYSQQIGIAVATSLVFWFVGLALNGGHSAGGPGELLPDAGFLTGIVIARPLEMRIVNFDPLSSPAAAKILRFFLTVALVLCTPILLNLAFAGISVRFAALGLLLPYVSFTAAGVVNIFIAPLLFTRLGLAKTMPSHGN